MRSKPYSRRPQNQSWYSPLPTLICINRTLARQRKRQAYHLHGVASLGTTSIGCSVRKIKFYSRAWDIGYLRPIKCKHRHPHPAGISKHLFNSLKIVQCLTRGTRSDALRLTTACQNQSGGSSVTSSTNTYEASDGLTIIRHNPTHPWEHR